MSAMPRKRPFKAWVRIDAGVVTAPQATAKQINHAIFVPVARARHLVRRVQVTMQNAPILAAASLRHHCRLPAPISTAHIRQRYGLPLRSGLRRSRTPIFAIQRALSCRRGRHQYRKIVPAMLIVSALPRLRREKRGEIEPEAPSRQHRDG